MITTSQTDHCYDGWVFCLSSPDNKIIRIEGTKQARICDDHMIDTYNALSSDPEKMHFAWAIPDQFYTRYAQAALANHRLNLIKQSDLDNYKGKPINPELFTCLKKIKGGAIRQGYVEAGFPTYFETSPNRAKKAVVKHLIESGYGQALVPARRR